MWNSALCRYCKAEANLAFRSKIPMVPVCVEEGYEADNWLALITAAAHGYDCSTDEMLTSSMDGVVKELLHALRLRKDGKRCEFANNVQ